MDAKILKVNRKRIKIPSGFFHIALFGGGMYFNTPEASPEICL